MLDPQIHRFLDDWAQAWARLPADAGIADSRRFLIELTRDWRNPDLAGVATQQDHVAGPGRDIRIRLFRPDTAEGPRPAMVYFHGGGWVRGAPETTWDITAGLARDAGMVVISVDYALAPEFRFPEPIRDGRAVLAWLGARARQIGVDLDRLFLAGDSSGGNIAAALALDARRAGLRLAGQVLIYPAMDADDSRPSYHENAEGPILLPGTMREYWAQYCPNGEFRRDALAAPLLAGDLALLPDTYIGVAEHDILRDSGLAYAQALRDAGVAVETDPGAGLVHGYYLAERHCDAVRRCRRRMTGWIRSRL